ncbi:hypothetical protein P9112_000753 [Eukaryota sp. TZLM1-RC]
MTTLTSHYVSICEAYDTEPLPSVFTSLSQADEHDLPISSFSLCSNIGCQLHGLITDLTIPPLFEFFTLHMFTTLSSLDLSFCTATSSKPFSSILIKLPLLTHLTLRSTTISDWKPLFQSLSRSAISHLDIGNNDISHAANVLISNISAIENLCLLNLENTRLNYVDLFDLFLNLRSNRVLKSLNIASNYSKLPHTALYCAISDLLGHNSTLTSLDFGNLGFMDLPISQFIITPLIFNLDSKITKLSLAKNHLALDTVHLLSRWLKSTRFLTHLDLAGCRLTDECVTILAKGIESTQSQLTFLNFSRNLLTEKGVLGLLEGIVNLKSGTTVLLSNNKFDQVTSQTGDFFLEILESGVLFDVNVIKEGDFCNVYLTY